MHNVLYNDDNKQQNLKVILSLADMEKKQKWENVISAVRTERI